MPFLKKPEIKQKTGIARLVLIGSVIFDAIELNPKKFFTQPKYGSDNVID